MLFFRPLPALTVACAILFAFLVGLGVWQLQRLHWKLALIETMTRNMHVRPVAIDDGGALYPEWENDYLHVTATGRFDNGKEAYVFGIGPEGGPVYHVIVPFHGRGGKVFLVDRGIVPRDMKNPATRPAGIRNGKAGVMEFFKVLHEVQQLKDFTPQKFVATDDTVCVIGHTKWTMNNNGVSGENDWVHVITFKDGKIIKYRGHQDTGLLAEAYHAKPAQKRAANG